MRLHETHMTRCLNSRESHAIAARPPSAQLLFAVMSLLAKAWKRHVLCLIRPLTPMSRPCLQLVNIKAPLNLSGCALYTTVEPCVLCGYAIRKSGIAQVVYGMPTSQAGAITSSYKILSDETLIGWPPPPAVITGVLAEQCAALLRR
jgi:hypothetical protein